MPPSTSMHHCRLLFWFPCTAVSAGLMKLRGLPSMTAVTEFQSAIDDGTALAAQFMDENLIVYRIGIERTAILWQVLLNADIG